jgi:hypothetical protein
VSLPVSAWIGIERSAYFAHSSAGRSHATCLKTFGVNADLAKCESVSDTKPARVFRLTQDGRKQPVFFAAGSIADKPGQPDVRDLRTISDVTCEALTAAAKIGFRRVSMGLIGAGSRRPAEPAYCLLAQLSGVRAFFWKDHLKLRRRLNVSTFMCSMSRRGYLWRMDEFPRPNCYLPAWHECWCALWTSVVATRSSHFP